MTTKLAVFSILVSYILVLIRKPYISPILIWNINATLPIIGFAQICDMLGRPSGWFLVVIAPLMFSLASWYRFQNSQYKSLSKPEVAKVKMLYIFVLILTLYHFYRIGIPAFSGNSETNRFTSISDSGLFGLPGRMVLFGLPILAILVIIKRQHFSKYFLASVLITWLVSRVLLGFKGGILEIIILSVTGLVASNFKFRLRTGVYFFLCLLLGFGYAIWIGSRYQSLTGRTLNLEYFLVRMTNGAAVPQWIALDQGSWLASSKNPIQIDFQYFLNKYFGIGSPGNLTYDKLISTYVYNTPRSLSAFIVPVTVGGSVYLISSIGFLFTPIVIILLGLIYAFTIGNLNGWRLSKLLLAVTFVLGVTVFFSNGNLVYIVINYAVVFIILITLLKILGFIVQEEKFDAN